MDADKSSISQDTVTNVAYPVRCTEELLLPFFTDVSLRVTMDTPPPPLPRPASNHAPISPLSEIRLVLLGRKGAGKSAAGNTILGAGFESGKPTEECVKRRADVAGTKVTVVDTPGWEWYYPLNSTPNWVRRETLRSVSLCPPGPHAVLLVVRSCASVNKDYISEIEEHLKPLGTKVWEHTMVLFTRGDELGLVSMEQRIQTSGPGLQTLLQKCGTRYHVMENRTKGDGTQVKELIRKLRKMVEAKEERSKHLEMNNTVLLELEADGKRRARERRKKQRQMEAQAQRGTIKTALMSDNLQTSESDAHHSFSKTPRRLPEIRLVLLGERETGKSSAGNAILGHPGLFESGTVTEECVRHQATVAMRQVTVVDTPGWDGGVMGSTPERVKREIVSSVVLCPPGPHAVLLTLRVDTAVRESHIREHLELLGDEVWRYTILLLTHGDQLREGVNIKQHIQKGGRDLQTLLARCSSRYHMMSNSNGLKNATQVIELLEKVEKMAATNRCEAFSGLVQEVKNLSRQRNEKYNQRFKELQDKLLRQEAELKNMRDREMKSLRWFFDRKKKVKSPGNLKKEEEEDEDKRSIDRNIEELEDRMRLMIEDKEREIQDLNVEHERILAALHQSRREAEEAGLNVEMKVREIEELNERIDEQQLKMLDLECVAVGHEQDKKQYKETMKEWEKAAHKLQESANMAAREIADWKGRVDKLKVDLDSAKRHYDEELVKIMQEKDTEVREVEVKMTKQIEVMLSEKDKDIEQQQKIVDEEKQRALDCIKQNEQEMQRKMDEMARQHQKEKDEIKINMKDDMEAKICEMDNKLELVRVQHFEEVEAILKQHHNEINEKLVEIEALKKQLAQEATDNKEIKQRELAEMEQKYLDIVKEKSSEYEKQKQVIVASHKQEMNERDKEMVVLKEQHQHEMAREKFEIEKTLKNELVKKIKEKQDEIETLREKHAEELEAKMSEYEKEKERYVMERDKEIEDLKNKYMEDINEKDKEIEQILEEKEGDVERLKGIIEELKQKYMEELDCMTEMQAKLENKQKEIFELKEFLKEAEGKLQATEAKKEQERKQIELKLVEKEQLIQMLNEKLKDIEEMLQKKEDERGQILLSQKKEAELQLEIRDKEMNEIKHQLLNETERYAESVKMIERQKVEIAKIKNGLTLKEVEIEEAVKMQERYVQEIKGLKDCVKRYTEIEESYRNKEAEMMDKIQEKDNDLEQMRLRIEQTKTELNDLTHKMEKEMTSLIQEYERGIERRNDEIAIIVKEKDAVIKGLEEEKQQKVLEITEKFGRSQKRIEELEEKIVKEIEKLEIKCEQLKDECEEKDKQLKSKESEIENICKNYQGEVLELGQTNNKLKSEIEKMKDEFEKQVAELKEQLKEKQLKDNEMKKDLAEKLKGIELWEKEKQDFEQKVLMFESKQEELVRWEMALVAKQTDLDKKDQCVRERQKDIEQKEQELDKLLKALETKQMELSYHGQDLQKKVRGLKDQGKELKDKEFSLRSQEQELIHWTSELHAQNEHVSYTTQQLDEMGRDLAVLKEELQHKEKKYKTMFEKLNKWEAGLQEREAELSSRQRNLELSKRAEDNGLMYKDIGKTGKVRDREDQKMAEKGNNCHFETLQEIGEQKEGSEMQSQEVDSVKVIRDLKVFAKRPKKHKASCDLTILMLRESWSSRSPAGFSILGGEEQEELTEIKGSSYRSWRGQIAGRHVAIVEPLELKWRDGTSPNASSKNILEAVSWCESVPDVVLLIVPAFLTCTEKYRKAMEDQVNLVGDDIWKQTMVLFTWGETIGVNMDQHIQRNGDLRRLVEKCAGRYHVLTSKKSNTAIKGLFEKMDEIVA